jgi:HK97 gp10 family phage protein
MRALFEITGDKELDKILKDLGQNALKDSQIKQALRKIAKPVIASLKSNVKNSVTGKLVKSMGIIPRIKSPKGKPFILVGSRYHTMEDGGHMVELVEFGSQYYDVSFEGHQIIRTTYQQHKTKTVAALRKELLLLLDKKLKKLKG